MGIRLIALDIDGTILTSNEELSARTRQSIRWVQKQDLHVILATGRRIIRTLPWAEALGVNDLLVVHNGAVIYDMKKRQTVAEWGIDLEIAGEIINLLEEEQINYVVYTGESGGERLIAPAYAWKTTKHLMLHYCGEVGETVPQVKLTIPPIRISLIDRPKKVDPLYNHLISAYGNGLNVMLFGAQHDDWHGIEVIAGSCSKGTGVAYVCDKLGVEPHEVIAIGDNVNDLEMIKWAGVGVAMENAPLSVRQAADLVAASNDQDGVAQILENILFEYEVRE